jgi:hypothetical protein
MIHRLPTKKMRQATHHEECLFRETVWFMGRKTGLYTYDPKTSVLKYYSDDLKEKGTILLTKVPSPSP